MAHVWHPIWPDATFATLHYFAPSIGAIHAHSDDPDTASLTVLCSFHNEFWPGKTGLQYNLAAILDISPVASVEILEVEDDHPGDVAASVCVHSALKEAPSMLFG